MKGGNKYGIIPDKSKVKNKKNSENLLYVLHYLF